MGQVNFPNLLVPGQLNFCNISITLSMNQCYFNSQYITCGFADSASSCRTFSCSRVWSGGGRCML